MTMTDLTAQFRPAPLAPFAAEPRFAAGGLVLVLSLAVTSAAALIDPRLFQDEGVWLKPVKFQIALAIYLLSLAFFARWLPAGMSGRRWWRVYAGIVLFCIAAEMAWIGGAAMAGTGSHFNVASPVMAALYSVMGVFAVALTSPSLVMGIAIWRNPASGLPPALRIAIALGLVLTFALTVPVAGTMAQGDGHFVGTPLTGATVPLFGWSREAGDLRVAHFLATHAMHAIPLAGLAATALLPRRLAVAAVCAAAGLFVALVLWTFAAALAGYPLIPMA
jgi:hypothetical protein